MAKSWRRRPSPAGERVLARGETLGFCGFYLDCHLGVAVEGVDQRAFIGDGRAAGRFYVVQVRVSSDARQATRRGRRIVCCPGQFDLPEGLEPRLPVTDVAGVDRVLERILIGDDDSLFHQPTALALH